MSLRIHQFFFSGSVGIRWNVSLNLPALLSHLICVKKVRPKETSKTTTDITIDDDDDTADTRSLGIERDRLVHDGLEWQSGQMGQDILSALDRFAIEREHRVLILWRKV